MSREQLCGTWQISKCFLNEQIERLGLEGITFRLDELGDITWYNDLSHLTAATGPEDFEDISESADVLFSCEMYEVLPATQLHGPQLLFVANAGYSIEFKVDTLRPEALLSLHCDGWYTLQCARVATASSADESTSSPHDGPFTLLDALDSGYDLFADCTIESADGRPFRLHSSVLRLSGFDASSCMPSAVPSAPSPAMRCFSPTRGHLVHTSSLVNLDGNSTGGTAEITIAIIPPSTPGGGGDHHHHYQPQRASPKAFLLSPKLLISPTLELFHLPSKLASNLSNSFNCLAAAGGGGGGGVASTIASSTSPMLGHHHHPHISTSDSNLKSSTVSANALTPGSGGGAASRPNIFTFVDAAGRQPRVCPPLSPYRSKSPLWTTAATAGSAESSPPPLSPLTPVQVLQSLAADDLRVLLHWLYAECLPAGLAEPALVRLVAFAEGCSRLGRLADLGHAYLALVRLQQLVQTVLAQLHASLERTIRLLAEPPGPLDTRRSPPALWSDCQAAGRELAVAAATVLQFAHIFVRDQPQLTRPQRHEIIRYVRARLPAFVQLARRLLLAVRALLAGLSAAEREALVEFLVPEVGDTLRRLRDLVARLKHSLRSMYDELKAECQAEQRRCSNAVRKLGGGGGGAATDERRSSKSLRFVLYVYEMQRMRDVYGRISTALEIVDEKRVAFDQMTAANQAETMRRNLEQLMAELPALEERLDSCAAQLEGANGWKEFKFFFKVATNQINSVVAKLLDHQNALNDTISHVCLLVARPPFTQVLVELGLLDARSAAVLDTQAEQHQSQQQRPISIDAETQEQQQPTAQLNLAQHCCDPLRQSVSSLAKNALRLLHSGLHSDMEFEIIVMQAPPYDDGPSPTGVAAAAAAQVHIFRAHRVIVATRCEWFHKALASGMQESIHRRITVHDTSPVIFRRLLLFLYGAPVDRSVGAEPLCELMLLADRFSVDSLKAICERTLRALIDESSVLCLLAMADRLSATALKANCFAYISQHADVVRSEVFKDLPRAVQQEVHELLLWCGRVPEPWRERKPSKKRSHKAGVVGAGRPAAT